MEVNDQLYATGLYRLWRKYKYFSQLGIEPRLFTYQARILVTIATELPRLPHSIQL
jgi:hypothetical protein